MARNGPSIPSRTIPTALAYTLTSLVSALWMDPVRLSL